MEDQLTEEDLEIYQENVNRGAELLDEIVPGWHKAINKRLLNLATTNPTHPVSTEGAKRGTGCVLCQLDDYICTEKSIPTRPLTVENFGSFSHAIDQLNEYVFDYDFDPTRYGFDLDYDIDSRTEAQVQFETLDDLWKHEIDKRLDNEN